MHGISHSTGLHNTQRLHGAYTPASVHRKKSQQTESAAQPGFKLSLSEQSKHVENSATQHARREKPIPAALQPLIQDVQTVANELGYLDISPQAIVSAYKNQQSFLADVHV